MSHRQDLFQDVVRWFDSQGLARPLPRHLELILDMLQAAGVTKEIKFSPAEDIANEIAIHAARAETRTVADQAQLEEQLRIARGSFNRDVERERQAAAETCKAAEQRVETLGRDLAEEQREHSATRSELRKLQEQYDTLSEQAHESARQVAVLHTELTEKRRIQAHQQSEIRAHRQAHQETSADVKAILEACGAQADVDEGRDPIEAARSIRDSLNSATDHAIALKRDRDNLRISLRAILRANVRLALGVIETLDSLCPADEPEPNA